MSRQAPYQNPTVPPQGFQPIAFLAVRALRSVLERPDEFLAAFFSSMPEPAEGTSVIETPPCFSMETYAVENAQSRRGRAPNQSEEPPCLESLIRLFLSRKSALKISKGSMNRSSMEAPGSAIPAVSFSSGRHPLNSRSMVTFAGSGAPHVKSAPDRLLFRFEGEPLCSRNSDEPSSLKVSPVCSLMSLAGPVSGVMRISSDLVVISCPPMVMTTTTPLGLFVTHVGPLAGAPRANDSHLGGVGQWGCAVTPPLCTMDGTPALLSEQAG